jgi:glutamate-ammonia-ligase adenylyltransferase
MPEWLREESEEKFESLCQTIEKEGGGFFPAGDLENEARRVLPCSDFIYRSCLGQPALLPELHESGDLYAAYGPEEYHRRLCTLFSGVETEEDLARLLRRFRCREMVRIAWRDLAGRAGLDQTVSELSALADAVLQATLTTLYRQQCETAGVPKAKNGRPQELVVMAMGKLGARELNFSSDIDLVFAYPDAGRAAGPAGEVSNDEWFAQLCRSLLRVVGRKTADGMVFRIDTRLRPDGENGPLVMSFDNMESYYQVYGREWERYAWIKVRPVAGDLAAGRRLIRRLAPFVYRRYLDFGTFDALRQMKRSITLEVRRRGLEEDVKLGPGGIREVEFFGQIFQLIRGGVLPALQVRPICEVLRLLADHRLIPAQTAREMIDAYRFLRMVEHRIQEFSDQQTQRLPTDDRSRQRLAYASGYPSWGSFAEALAGHRETVHGHFSALLEPEEALKVEGAEGVGARLAAAWRGDAETGESTRVLSGIGFGRPEEVLRRLRDLKEHTATRSLSREGRQRLDLLIPDLLKLAGAAADPETLLGRLLELLQAIQRRTTYLALLREHPSALVHLARLVQASPWISAYLARHPALLDELLDPRTLYAPPLRSELEDEIERRLSRSPEPDLEHLMEELCLFKQVNTLRVAAADITGVLPLMRVSDHLSSIAEVVLGAVLSLAWNHLVERHGRPPCRMGGVDLERGFAVVAYGKLGGFELGYGSDLDLVFLHAGSESPTIGGKKPVDSTTFFARLGQRVLHLLTAHTAAGLLYEIDMRLRPSGASGLLVSPVEAFGEYQRKDAWTWEHQALVRARPVGGDPEMADAFARIRRQVLCRDRDPVQLAREVADMRDRIRREQKGGRAEEVEFDLKQGRGGLVDIEFLVQYLVLRHAPRHESLLAWTDNVRLIRTLNRAGVLDDDTAALLRTAYLTFRSKMHRLSLQQQPARVPADRYRPLREGVRRIWHRFLAKKTKKS